MHKTNRFKTSVLSLFLVLTLLFGTLTACGTSEPADTGSSISSETGSEKESASTGGTTSETESETTSEPESEEQTDISDTTPSETESESQKDSQSQNNSESQKESESQKTSESQKESESKKESESQKDSQSQKDSESTTKEPTDTEDKNTSSDLNTPGISLSDIPAYSSDYYIVLNNNIPHFSTTNLTTESYEFYSELDSLGRCGVAYACLGKDLMPADGESRGSISSVKPTGWHTTSYSCVPGSSLYNRSHLIAWSLANENANKKNLITGTEHLNQKEMTKFEEMVRDYIKETGNHVMYRVTPYFDGQNLIATGVQMEAWSVEDNGEDICFNVFIYNVQDGIYIDYATGESYEINPPASETESDSGSGSTSDGDAIYMVNKNNGKIHKITCGSVTQTAEKNRVFFSTWEEALAYSIEIDSSKSKIECGNCHAYSENQD